MYPYICEPKLEGDVHMPAALICCAIECTHHFLGHFAPYVRQTVSNLMYGEDGLNHCANEAGKFTLHNCSL